jgi:rhodanese-related sulfurtransferase
MQKLLFLSLITLFSCSQNAQTQNVLDAEKTENMLKSDGSVQLVDVRTPSEWQQTGVIEGAKRINFNGADFQEQIALLDKNKPVIVYCAAGGRSPKAASMMIKMGFNKVYNYSGGMNDWKAKGKKTVQ